MPNLSPTAPSGRGGFTARFFGLPRATWAAFLLLSVLGSGCASAPRAWDSRSAELLDTQVSLADRGIVPAEVTRSLPAGPPFSELLVSWNIAESAGSTVVVEVRVKDEDQPWGPWLELGWQGLRPSAPGLKTSQLASIDVDYLRAVSPLSAAECRVRVVEGSAVVHRLSAVATSGRPEADPHNEADRQPPPPVVLDVPFRSQKTDRPELSGRLCSPTSVTMVLAYFGVNASVHEVASRSYDPEHDLYGNWPRNIAAGYSFGLSGRLVRFSRWPHIERVLRSGRPIVASIFVEPGQLRGAPYRSSEGHLIVLRGVTESGDILVNDPAATNASVGSLVYRRDDLTTVWLSNTKGTAYVFDPPAGSPRLVPDAR